MASNNPSSRSLFSSWWTKLLLITCLAAASPSMALAAPAGWNSVWNDEFDTLDLTKWTRINTNHTTNNSLQDYLPQQVTVSAGNLVYLAKALDRQEYLDKAKQAIDSVSGLLSQAPAAVPRMAISFAAWRDATKAD